MRTYKQVAEDTSDAYSFDRYANWEAVCKKLMTVGKLTDNQCEAVVRSKWTRWAADMADRTLGRSYRYGNFPAKAVLVMVQREGMDKVRELTFETLGVYE